MRAPETDAGPIAAAEVACGPAFPALSTVAVLFSDEQPTAVNTSAATTQQRRTEIIVASTLLPAGNQVVLRSDYLPLRIASLPRIGEAITSVERALLPPAPQMQNAGDHLDVAEVVHPHALVTGPVDAIRARHTPDDVASTHQRRILRVNEVRGEQPLE